MTNRDLYKVGIIGRTGAGDYGHHLDRGWAASERARVVAVADHDEAGRQEARARTGAERCYADYRDMLAHEELDVVVVAPRHLDCHEEMVLAAAASGCHVYCEKPIAQSLDQADRMVGAMGKLGLRFAVALPFVHEPRAKVLAGLIGDGVIGDVYRVEGLCKCDHRGGGQDFLILGIHFADMMRRLVGDPESCFGRAARSSGRPIGMGDVEVGAEHAGLVAGASIWASYLFPRGVIGTIESWRFRIQDRDLQPYRLNIYGSHGILSVRAPYADSSIWRYPFPAVLPGRAEWQQIETVAIPAYGNYHKLAADDFLAALDEDRQPKCSGADGLAALEMIHALYASSLAQGPVSLPLAQREHPLRELLIQAGDRSAGEPADQLRARA